MEWLENYVRKNGLEEFGAYIGSGVELGKVFLVLVSAFDVVRMS